MAQRIYEGDAYSRAFDAYVTGCAPGKGGWLVTLDRTAFYPEGGGQPGDMGLLGSVRVLDTREKDGEVVHVCGAPLETGAHVHGEIDWARRFDHMQQHSGEHIVSGLICARFGCDNVGFHLGAKSVVIDFNYPIPPEALPGIERAANEAIWENRPFLVSHPGPEALAALEYRSKKELHGDVRIVECPGADRCACCGTHVKSAGELGLIKITDRKPFREGVRLEMLAGARAYDYVCMAAAQNHAVSVLASVPEGGTAGAVERLQAELASVKYRCVGLENRVFAQYAEQYAGKGDALLFLDGLTPEALRRCCLAVAERCGGRCAVFSGEDGEFHYAVSGYDAKALNAALHGRGGGKNGFAQGSAAAARAEIEAYFLK
ncbi:MAG: alanyl-tRNA editing protein [Oscillospiraceae bacterium]|nr:alanyl-tRNA editing protein [Oscillospiraceae bacterium]